VGVRVFSTFIVSSIGLNPIGDPHFFLGSPMHNNNNNNDDDDDDDDNNNNNNN